MEFLHPGLLWLSTIAPILFYLRLRRKSAAVPMPGLSLLKTLPRARLGFLPPLLIALAAILLAVAAAGPRSPIHAEERKMPGIDVALALDVSGSMRAEDLKPSRMEAAKAKVKEFIQGFKQGRMALVAFAGRSFTQCPLTLDGGILEGLVDQLDPDSIAIDGTAIGDAIINCINKFKEESVSRVIILLTDGENNAGTVDPIAAARAAQAKGIKIYAIGVGTPGGAPIPMYNPAGEKFYARDQMGNLILEKVDADTLKSVAELTGGAYFPATDERALGEVYKKIAAMEKREITVKRVTGYREYFPYPAGAALVLMLIGAVLWAGKYRVFG